MSTSQSTDEIQLSTAVAVTSVLLTGAFIFNLLNVPSILNVAFLTTTGSAPPDWYSLALNSVGSYALLFNLFYVTLFHPIECLGGIQLPAQRRIEIRRISARDFISLWLVSLVYIYIIVTRGVDSTVAIYGGLIVILSSQILSVVPRWVGERLDRNCFWALKIVVISIPISVALFIPTVLFVAWA